MSEHAASNGLLGNSSDIVRSYITRNSVPPNELAKLITEVHKALATLEHGSTLSAVGPVLTSAVSVKKSVTPDYLVCLDDGKRFKSMKRHIGQLGMTPEEYRSKWGLPSTYPMVAPNYSKTRSALAKSNGLGRKLGETGKRRAKASS